MLCQRPQTILILFSASFYFANAGLNIMLDATYQIPQYTNDYTSVLTINGVRIVKDKDEVTTIDHVRYTNFKLYDYIKNVLKLTAEEITIVNIAVINPVLFSFKWVDDHLILCLGTTYTFDFTFDKGVLSSTELKIEFGSRVTLDQSAIDAEFENILNYLQIGFSYDLVEITEYLTRRNYKEYKG